MRYDDRWWARWTLTGKFHAEVLFGFFGILFVCLPLFVTLALWLSIGLLGSRWLDPNVVESWFFLPMLTLATCLTLGLSSWWIERTCRKWVQRFRLDISNLLLSIPFINMAVVAGKLSNIDIPPPSSRS